MSTTAALAMLVAAWSGSLIGHVTGSRIGPAGLAVAVGLSGGSLLAVVGRRMHGAKSKTGDGGRRPGLVAGCACLVAAVSCLGAGLRTQAVNTGPAATLVGDPAVTGVAVQAELQIVGDPLRGGFGGARVPARFRAFRPLSVPDPSAEVPTRERVLAIMDDADVARVPFGTWVEVRGLLEPIPEASLAWTRSLGIVLQLRVAQVVETRPPPTLRRWANSLRRDTAAAAHRTLDPARASLLTGLTTGDLTGQPAQVAEQVDRSGLRHLVAVSGSNVALIVAATAGLVIAIGAGRRAAWWCSILAVWWLVTVVRAEPSVIRASLMATVVLAALLRGRARSPMHVLAVGGTVALLGDPLLAGRLGFALSMAATAGVLAIAPRVSDLLPAWLPRPVTLLVGATCGAQMAVAPLLLAIGSPLHPASVSANLVAVPAAAVGSLIGALTSVAAVMSVPLGSLVAGWASPALTTVLWAARFFSSEAGRTLSVWLVGAATLGVALSWLGRRADAAVSQHDRVSQRVVGFLARPVLVVLGLTLALVGVRASMSSDGVTGGLPDAPVMVVLDVGQGDATLLGDPDAGWMLVDGGAEDADVVGALRRMGIRRLARVVATHADADHVGGLADVLNAVPVEVVTVGPRADDATELLATAVRLAVPVEQASTGHTWHHGRFEVTVLSPPGTGLGLDRNDNSLVMRIDGLAGTPSILLPGDAEVLAQEQLLRAADQAVRLALDVDVLLVPHHGGNTSSPAFLAATTPDVAIISVGADNTFGHPHPDVLAALVDVDVRRTDLDGDVVIPLTTHPPTPSRGS